MNNTCPRLIEVAMPIREISAESVRDKSLRHGHISTLHLWWARRPLAVSRAVVFASLVPDPDDPDCPEEFQKAVEHLLKAKVPSQLKSYRRGRNLIQDEDPYLPYAGIPDTLRNRLIAFIAKWSPGALAFEQGKSNEAPKPAELLDDRSLVKWETSDPNNPQGKVILQVARELVKTAYEGKTPTILDPFAGGGAIPLEVARLGCQAIGNDYNPVAYLILRATCEFPQKYGKRGKRKVVVEEFGRKVEQEIEVPNVLMNDVEKWSSWILKRTQEKISHIYPAGKDKRPVIGYIWARTAPCANPSCKGEIPLIQSFLLCKRNEKKIALAMDVNKVDKKVRFKVIKGDVINQTKGTMQKRGNVLCPYCNQVTPVSSLRNAGLSGSLGEKMVAVITQDSQGKMYRDVEQTDLNAFEISKKMAEKIERPDERNANSNDAGLRVHNYGFKTFGSLFNPRQLVAMKKFIESFHETIEIMKSQNMDGEYYKAVQIYIGLWISRTSMFMSTTGLWKPSGEFVASPFSKQAIPMVWDYPEVPLLAESSGGAPGQINWILRVIKHESANIKPGVLFCRDGYSIPLNKNSTDLVVTDPPYFNSIAYADLSDFFYVWLKRAFNDSYKEPFATQLSPKTEEATALKHRHNGDKKAADIHFREKISKIFEKSKLILKRNGLLTVLFAHQSTEAWTALVNALFNAGLTIIATWPIDTERAVRSVAIDSSALASSITIACRSRVTGGAASLKEVRKKIEKVVQESVKRFWSYGFRGADLIVACYGPAVGVFGKYERVEKGDGTPVDIPDLLELARKAARDAIAGEFRGDNLSTLYYVWANLYGVVEQAWDDARLVVQIGGDEDNAMEVVRGQGIFVVDGSKCRLALLEDRSGRRGLGIDQNPALIDALHRAMLLWKEEKRGELVSYLAERDLLEDGPFWKLAQALFEVLPRDIEDWKFVNALLSERQTLRAEGKRVLATAPQKEMFED